MDAGSIEKNSRYENLNKEIKIAMRISAKDMVRLGYMLRQMLEEKLYLVWYDCYEEYLSKELHIDYTAATRFIKCNKKYSIGGNSMELAPEYAEYSRSLLVEMLNMPPGLEARVTPDMTVKQAREVKRQEKQQKEEPVVQAVPMEENITDAEFREIPAEPEKVATSQPGDEEEFHDKDWFIRQYVNDEPLEVAKLFKICRSEKNNSNRAKAIQKHLAPYGCHGTHCAAYCYDFHDFAGGMDFRVGEEEQHLTYNALAAGLMKILEEQEENAEPETAEPEETEKVQDVEEQSGTQTELWKVKDILREEKKLLHNYLEVGGLPERTVERQKIIVGALASMVYDLENTPDPEPQPDLPVFKNNDQRKAWLSAYKEWGLWYRDGNLDVNYYKYDFHDGSRLVVAEYPQRQSYYTHEHRDEHYYHLLEKNIRSYAEKFREQTDSETYLVEFLKNLQKERIKKE